MAEALAEDASTTRTTISKNKPSPILPPPSRLGLVHHGWPFDPDQIGKGIDHLIRHRGSSTRSDGPFSEAGSPRHRLVQQGGCRERRLREPCLTRVEEDAGQSRAGGEGVSGGVSFWHFVVLSPVPKRQNDKGRTSGRGPSVPFATIRKGIPRRSPDTAICPFEMGLTASPLDAVVRRGSDGVLCRQGSRRSLPLRSGGWSTTQVHRSPVSRLRADFAPSAEKVLRRIRGGRRGTRGRGNRPSRTVHCTYHRTTLHNDLPKIFTQNY